MSDTKEKVLEIAEIAKLCPDNLQPICFEVLLRNYLDSLAAPQPKSGESSGRSNAAPATDDQKPLVDDSSRVQDDLSAADLHLKVKHFMKKHGVTLDHLNNLFYKEGSTVLPLYEDLKTTRLAEGQIRIALLQSLRNAIANGDFRCTVADVRAECTQRKCYDQNNFAGNFTTNASLFDFEKYSKGVTSLGLSEDGKKELAEVIQELQ